MSMIHLLRAPTTVRAAEHVPEARRNGWLSRTHVGVQYLVFRNNILKTQRRPILPPATTRTGRSLAPDWIALFSPQYLISRWWICDPTGQQRPRQSRAPRPTILIELTAMTEWSNPVPPIPSLRLKYRKINGGTPQISTFAMSALCTVAGALWVEIVLPQMGVLVLRVMRIFRLSFVPYEIACGVSPPQTERQAVERMVFRTSLVIGRLFLLWPLLIMSFLSAMEGVLWVTGLNAIKPSTHLWVLFESFMGLDLLFYYGDMAEDALMLDETRQIELVDLTTKLWRDREGKR